MAMMEISKRMYIVTPRTVGLTRSPPGVTTVANTAMPRITYRRAERRRCDVTIPIRDRMNSTIGNCMVNPNARNIVLTNPK